MFKKLRWQIIMIELAAFLFVTVIILASINIISHAQINKSAHQVLTLLSENSGKLPDDYDNKKYTKYDFGFNSSMNAETPYNTRYFYVTLDTDGNITDYNLKHIAAISEDNLSKIVNRVYKVHRDEGSVSTYRYLKVGTSSGMIIYFVDCYIQKQYFNYILKTSFFIGFLCMIIVFFFVYFLSGKAICPMEKNMELQKQFVTDASHELKTPLAAISANVDVLELINDNPDAINTTKKIKCQISQLNTLINEMLTLTKINSTEHLEHPFENVNISNIVNQQIADMEPVIKQKNIILNTSINDDICCMARNMEISRLFSVLLDNAVKYCTPEGAINITLSKDRSNLHYIITNSSDGIDENDLEHIFDRFYRGDKARNRNEGSYGIGLSIAKAIVISHKGKITAKNTNQGVQFAVNIPLKHN